MAIRVETDPKWKWTGAFFLGAGAALMTSLIWSGWINVPIPPSDPADQMAYVREGPVEPGAGIREAGHPADVPPTARHTQPPEAAAELASAPPARAETKPQAAAHETAAPASTKRAALTFDDGPDAKYTPAILDLLKEHQVKATFFVVGKQVDKHPDVLKRILDEGHAIGNHSLSHANFSKLTPKRMDEEIRETDRRIQQAAGVSTSMFRAPYGASPHDLKTYLKTTDRELVGWTVDTRDWAGTSPGDILTLIRDQTKPGGIILMHSFGGKGGDLSNTLEALPLAIDYLHAEGYTLVTVPELAAP
ncbi:polysaccharide deacetylase family protein [Paenibacillus puerhi]|uniref:polysaccharide deacetylase family protein n=1 Tax=Paenibacillus puerhi TaxID=2692622 RepID=UPI001356B9EC|nr:polysaccharide deacetylase family protein [Paenibacillus puerhi]